MLDSLLKSLKERPSSNVVFNQYQNLNILDNLKHFLNYLLKNRHDVLLIGEAPGYRGCKLTGIPFTSGSVIRASRHDIWFHIGNEIELNELESETTASVFWDFFENHYPIPILWNAFPFHPHFPGNPCSNRKPNRSEIEEGKSYLLMLHQIFQPKKLCSLGRVGQSILSELFPNDEIIYIRHPSRGGKNSFIKGMLQSC